MASLNKVHIIGNLGKDPEVRYTPSGVAVCVINVATSRKWKDKSTGDPMEETEWHRIALYDRLAELAGEWLRKGNSVYIEGHLKTRKWEKDGIDRYTTEIIGEQMQFLTPKSDGGGDRAPKPPPAAARSTARPPAAAPRPSSGTGFDDMDDSIPF